jgi:hypothetical protein
MAIMRRKVSSTDSEGTEHAVGAEAETLYDDGAVPCRAAEILCAGPRSRFTVEVRQPTTTRTVDCAFAKWMNERLGSPRDLAILVKLKELLKQIES